MNAALNFSMPSLNVNDGEQFVVNEDFLTHRIQAFNELTRDLILLMQSPPHVEGLKCFYDEETS